MKNYDEICSLLESEIGYKKCYDVNKRNISIGERRASVYFITSLTNDVLLERVISFCLNESSVEFDGIEAFVSKCISCADTGIAQDALDAAKSVLSGPCAIVIDGFESIITVDTRSLPGRSVAEPESDRVLRGARDGFCESLNVNVGLMRRRIRSSELFVKKMCIGRQTKTDIALCYMEKRVDKKFLSKLEAQLAAIDVDALSLGQESLAECLIKRKWYNIFPKFRYTERPDAACASVLEGSIILICDTSPQAMILPCAIFDFIQESDDFYFPPVIGTYLRILRIIVFVLTLFLTPVWYLLIKNPEYIPPWLSFIETERGGAPILFQLLLVEFTIDALKLASLNTPSTLGNSLSVVAGLIIGDFAIQTGWLSSDVILYMSFVAMSNFAQPSFELGYAFKFARIFLILLVALFDLWGLAAGTVLILVAIALNKTVDGSRSYLYPLIPWNGKAMLRQLFRVKLNGDKK